MDMVKRFNKFMVAAVSDTQKGFGPMNPAIKSVVPGKIMAGPAFTVKCYPGSIITVHKALCEAKPGDVLVIDGESDGRGALFGELMALQCKVLGFAGIVIDGAIRDIMGIRNIGIPVFARHVTPRVGSNRRLGFTQISISCGDVVVRPGDWIMGDDDGVVVIPFENLEEVVSGAEEREEKEKEIEKRIKNGELVVDILDMRETLYPKVN